MGVKRRRMQAITIGDDLKIVFYYLAYGRAKDDEIRVYISDGEIVGVLVDDEENEMAKASLLNVMPNEKRVTALWAWLRDEYVRREKGGLL